MNRMTTVSKKNSSVFIHVFTEYFIFIQEFFLRLAVRLSWNVLGVFVDKTNPV